MRPAEFRALRDRAFAIGKCPLLRFQFAVGIGWVRTVSVRARSHEQADRKARALLDRRYEKAGREAPVAFDLFLIECSPCP
jgi:hypothetical protein